MKRKWDRATVHKIWSLLWKKQDELNPRRLSWKNKEVIERWESYLEQNGFLIRKSRDCFYGFEDVLVLVGFRIRKTWKIGIPYDLADKILVLGGLP